MIQKLDCTKLGSDKAWIVQSLDRTELGSYKAWIVQSLDGAKLRWYKAMMLLLQGMIQFAGGIDEPF